jgi:Ca2+-binding EF-hand superfamily protein
VLNVEKQTIEFAAHLPPTSVQKQRTTAFMDGVFPQGKQEVSEGDLVGPQHQLVRVIFDAADTDGNGKLTKKEFEKYFAMQQATAEIALNLNYATRTPNFFQMMDDNLDGKLSVRELRTAWDRLIVLEPGEGKAVTRAVMQPSATLRVVQASLVQFDPTQNAVARPGAKTQSAAPLWHRKMDRNTDGDVSKAEFLGDAAAFAKLDANQDGLVSTEEALDFEKMARPKKK